MPATAQSFGTGSWGLSADETGLIIESISYDYSQSNKTIKNRTGNTVGITYYDEQCKVTLNGRLPVTLDTNQIRLLIIQLGILYQSVWSRKVALTAQVKAAETDEDRLSIDLSFSI
jgi:hypothetical protein